jgi:hypothetical protein
VPKSVLVSPFTAAVSEISYAPDDTITIEAFAPVPLSEARCVLRNGDGRIVKTVPLAKQDGLWVNRSVYTVNTDYGLGIWHAELIGTTPTGLTVWTDVRLWIRPSRAGAHPFLYFGLQDRSALLERSHSGQLSSAWDNLRAAALSSRGGTSLAEGASLFPLLDAHYLLPT